MIVVSMDLSRRAGAYREGAIACPACGALMRVAVTSSASLEVCDTCEGIWIDWFDGKHHVAKAYENGYHGAWGLLKANNYEAEPFLDWQMTPALLARYPMLYIPNAPCLSDEQCAMVREYVRAVRKR